ncbi:hypothetical protein Hanom_Chr02g00135491 [Helianthus anomalus]
MFRVRWFGQRVRVLVHFGSGHRFGPTCQRVRPGVVSVRLTGSSKAVDEDRRFGSVDLVEPSQLGQGQPVNPAS